MPSIPTYDAPTQELRPLQAPDQSTVVTPELLGAGAAKQMRSGERLLSAGDQLADAARRMQQREDADSVFRAETTLKDGFITMEQDWRQNRQGRFAKGITQDANKWFDEETKKHVGNLQNDEQKRIFTQRAEQLRLHAMNSFSGYEAAQLEKSHDEAWTADKGVTVSAAVSNPTPQSIDNARRELERLNRYQAARKGWEPEQLKLEILKDKTALHRQTIQQLAQSDPKQAQIYFDKFKDEIDGDTHAELGEYAKKATATSQGETAAGDTWAKLGPKKDDDPVELDKMEAEMRKQFGDNEFARKAGIAALGQRAQAHNSSQRERQAANANVVIEAYRKGAGISQLQRMPEFDALPGVKKAEIKTTSLIGSTY